MSGTPSISDSYTVLGSRSGSASDRVALVLLTRGPWMFRPQLLAEWHAQGFTEILCFEASVPRYDAAALVDALPGLRIVVGTAAGAGVRINRAAQELTSGRFLVVWDDQQASDPSLLLRLEKLSADTVAWVPELTTPQGPLPTVLVPALHGHRLKILPLGTDDETMETLFPFDYTALYDRRRFVQTGGFDPELSSPFWQKVDWGVRSRLWGERLAVSRGLKLSYRGTPAPDDETPDTSYPRFYLRNLAVRHAGDHGVLPWSRLWTHLLRSGRTWSAGWQEFREERRWVGKHRYRYRTDARVLTERWGDA